MIIRSIEFIRSAAGSDQFPKDDLPQVVFAGRSNVGKSSFINAILNNSQVARTSQKPGKTRLVNFFLINKAFYLVDLPGYGYANVDKKTLERFRILIEGYLESKAPIALAVFLLDIRRLPSHDDIVMKTYFNSRDIDILFVLTKADKLSFSQRQRQTKLITKNLGLAETEKIFWFSSKTKENRELILDELGNRIGLEE